MRVAMTIDADHAAVEEGFGLRPVDLDPQQCQNTLTFSSDKWLWGAKFRNTQNEFHSLQSGRASQNPKKITDCVILDSCVRFVVCLQEPTYLLVALLNARVWSKLPCLKHTVFVYMMLVCGGDSSPVHLTDCHPATINV